MDGTRDIPVASRHEPPCLTLRLSVYEAETLRLVCQAIGGHPDLTRRHVADDLDETLRVLGIKIPDKRIEGNIYLLEKERCDA